VLRETEKVAGASAAHTGSLAATFLRSTRSGGVQAVHRLGTDVLMLFNAVLAIYFVAGTGGYGALMIASWASVWLHKRQQNYEALQQLRESPATPPVTVIIAARNEQDVILDAARAALRSDYPGIQICIVDDGSSDATLERLEAAFELSATNLIGRCPLRTRPVRGFYLSRTFPNLLVISKENGGKPDALNAGLNICRTPYFCTLDADCHLEPDAILRLMRRIVSSPVNIAASGGTVRVLNGCTVADGVLTSVNLPRTALERFQVVEYLRSFLFGRTGWSRMGGTLIISGAFALFHRETVIEAGGFSGDTVTEDMELVVRLRRWAAEHGRTIRTAFSSAPMCWVLCPDTLRMLARQRRRWQLGLCQTLWKNRAMFFNRRFGAFGWVTLPFHALVEALGAVVETAGYAMIPLVAWLDPARLAFLVPLVVLSLALSALTSVAAVILEELTHRRYITARQLATLLTYALLENFGYRQVLLWYRFAGVVRFLRGFREWESVKHVPPAELATG
jgi:cellulose synthase/poly-beta-1,6-N-acetylglucosamine synthase-like glycosyltransferase